MLIPFIPLLHPCPAICNFFSPLPKLSPPFSHDNNLRQGNEIVAIKIQQKDCFKPNSQLICQERSNPTENTLLIRSS